MGLRRSEAASAIDCPHCGRRSAAIAVPKRGGSHGQFRGYPYLRRIRLCGLCAREFQTLEFHADVLDRFEHQEETLKNLMRAFDKEEEQHAKRWSQLIARLKKAVDTALRKKKTLKPRKENNESET
jgi:hypothetical protein